MLNLVFIILFHLFVEVETSGWALFCWKVKKKLGSVWANQPTLHSGGGSVALAVGVGDRWQAKSDRWHVTHDTWHRTSDNLKKLLYLNIGFIYGIKVNLVCLSYINIHTYFFNGAAIRTFCENQWTNLLLQLWLWWYTIQSHSLAFNWFRLGVLCLVGNWSMFDTLMVSLQSWIKCSPSQHYFESSWSLEKLV